MMDAQSEIKYIFALGPIADQENYKNLSVVHPKTPTPLHLFYNQGQPIINSNKVDFVFI